MLEHGRDFCQQTNDSLLRDDLEQLVRLAIREDLGRTFDLTTVSTVPKGLPAVASIRARAPGVAGGVDLIPTMIDIIGVEISVTAPIRDGSTFVPQDIVATLSGDARDILTCERTILNFLGRLCGIASWTRQHVQLIEDLPTRLYDTRKTTPGWRRLEKYAVHCGGGHNHRSGLYDAVLIKDNHLAAHHRLTGKLMSPREAVEYAREFVLKQVDVPNETIIEIEVDTLEQHAEALLANPDIILLDNMSNDQLCTAVAMRDAAEPGSGRGVQLEASGGVNLTTLRGIAETGVDRISVGALTHSAINLDLGLDWKL
ncbi:MAG: carboxylating nicotinate-nucleotide diphosphorylase [Pirellulaceae bacterium]